MASLGYGAWLAHTTLAIDAYPATYLRPAVPYNAISIANGLRLYHEACAGCHGIAGYGDGVNGEGLQPRPADLTAKHSADHTAGDLFWWLSHGMQTDGAPGPMPGFAASLEEEERWDTINFLRALSAAERTRWIPRDGPGWERIENLMREIDRLDQEKTHVPDDHVH